MAVWQFRVEFIPRENLIAHFGQIPKSINDEILWKENLDEGVFLPDDYEAYLSRLGKKEILENGDGDFNWGDFEGTHITIYCQDKGRITVFARFDAGEYDANFAHVVLEFSKKCNCVLLLSTNNIIEPDIDLFFDEFRNSRAFRFCKNPVDYLQSDEVRQLNEDIKKKLADDEFNINS